MVRQTPSVAFETGLAVIVLVAVAFAHTKLPEHGFRRVRSEKNIGAGVARGAARLWNIGFGWLGSDDA